MRTEQIAHMKCAIVALLISTAMTVAACAQGALAPPSPSPAPQRSVPAVTAPVPPIVESPVAVPAPPREANQPAPPARSAPGGAVTPAEAGTPTGDIAIGEIGPQPQSGGGLVTVPTGDWNYEAPPPETATATPTLPPFGDITLPGPPASDSPVPPAIIGNEAPATEAINGE